jgi:hypothetical protein
MNPDRRYPERVSRRYGERPRTARETRSGQGRRYSSRTAVQSTKALTLKLATLGVVTTLAIGGLIAAQMAAGKDPTLGPKAATRAKKAASSGAKSGGSTGSATATDPNAQTYGGYNGYYGSSSGYSSGSSGYSGSGYSTQQSAPAPVTSSTS